MSGDIEAAGAAITAGLAASAIERASPAHGETHASACLNCSASLEGAYCHQCGQPAHISRTLHDVWHDFLHGVFHFDTKAWKTLPLLVFRPGTLTNRYIHGQRARYIGPMAMFLLAVFLMFFVFSLVSNEVPSAAFVRDDTIASATEQQADARAEIADATADIQEARAEAGPGMEGVIAGAQARIRVNQDRLTRAERDLTEARARDALYRRALEGVDKDLAAAQAANDAETIASLNLTRQALVQAIAGDGAQVDSLELTQAPDGTIDVEQSLHLSNSADRDSLFDEIRRQNAAGNITVNTGIASWDKKIKEKLENPELAWYKIESTAYKFSFLLVPLSLPFIWLVFCFRRGTTLFDHAVFALYSLSFMSLLFVVVAVTSAHWLRIGAWFDTALQTACLWAVPVHLFLQLKGAYGLGWFSALWRTVVLGALLFVAFALFLIAILLMGLLG